MKFKHISGQFNINPKTWHCLILPFFILSAMLSRQATLYKLLSAYFASLILLSFPQMFPMPDVVFLLLLGHQKILLIPKSLAPFLHYLL